MKLLAGKGISDEVVQECAGASWLPGRFWFRSGVSVCWRSGQGSVWKLFWFKEIERDMEGPEVAFLSVQEQGNLEQAAKGYAQQQPQPSIKDLEKAFE